MASLTYTPPQSRRRAYYTSGRRSALWLCFLFTALLPLLAGAASLRLATFSCDATPPLGEPMLWATPLKSVEFPLLAKGVLFQESGERYVICTVDWCLIGNDSYQAFCRALAAGAGTTPDRVILHSIHQHAAPYADEGAARLLADAPKPLPHLSAGFLEDLRARLAVAVSNAAGRLQKIDRLGVARTPVERVASARRLVDANGKVTIRFSNAAKDPRMAAAPEGPIDPDLRTITFARGSKPLARLHFYATHPQTFCCDGRASGDFVAMAREAVQQEEGVFQMYLTGAAGDVTVGKYNDGSPGATLALAKRLETAMLAAAAGTAFTKPGKIRWGVQPVVFPLRDDLEVVQAQSRAWLNSPAEADGTRSYRGAMRLAFVERLGRPVLVHSMRLGDVQILVLPGEPMLEFQRFAQRSAPNRFVAVAGYGDCGPAYICTDEAIAQGAYEPEASNVGRGSEAQLKQAISALIEGPLSSGASAKVSPAGPSK